MVAAEVLRAVSKLIITVAASAFLALAGCAESEQELTDACKDDRISELETKVSALEDQLGEARSAARELDIANDGLQPAAREARDATDRFQYEDWRSVVPDAEDAAQRVDSAQTEVDEAAAALDDAVDGE